MPTASITVRMNHIGDSTVIHKTWICGRSRFCAMKIAASATRINATQNRNGTRLDRRGDPPAAGASTSSAAIANNVVVSHRSHRPDA